MSAPFVPAWLTGTHALEVHRRRLLIDMGGTDIVVNPRSLTALLGNYRIWSVHRLARRWSMIDAQGLEAATAHRTMNDAYEVESAASRYRFDRRATRNARSLRITAGDGREAGFVEAVFHRPTSAGASTAPEWTRRFEGKVSASVPIEAAVVGLAVRIMAGSWSGRTPRVGTWKQELLRDADH